MNIGLILAVSFTIKLVKRFKYRKIKKDTKIKKH